MTTHMFKKQSTTMFNPTTTRTTTSSSLGMHTNSRVISKVQPKIRIIHIFAPEIIKTDVANFRELVQRLTGKPSPENDVKGKGKGKCKGKKVKLSHDGDNNNECNTHHHHHVINTKLEVMMGSGSSSSPSSSSDHHTSHDDHDLHQEGWRSTAGDDHNSTTTGGFLTGFNDLDYNFDFNTMFHLAAPDASSHLNSLGEAQLSYPG